ncbi:MAG: hypothetical protein ACI35P_15345 [Bacillus sp. (in: firmicutes)]
MEKMENLMKNTGNKIAKKNNKKVSKTNVIVFSIILAAVLVFLDYKNIPTVCGFDMSYMNWDFLMGIFNGLVVIILYIITYITLDKRNVEREDNKKENVKLLFKMCYMDCIKYINMLDESTVKKYIVPKIDFNSTHNTIINNLQQAPFLNENIILDLVKDGQITKSQIEGYYEIREKYGQYVTMKIIAVDGPHIYKPLEIELNSLIEKELSNYPD